MTKQSKSWKGSRAWLPFLFLCMTGLVPAAAFDDAGVEDVPEEISRLKQDEQGRVLVDVEVRGEGPYPFLLDTAASRSVMYRTLVSELGLEAVPFKSRRVMTATGAREMQLFRIGELKALGKSLEVKETVAMPDPSVEGISGILGIDILRGHVLMLDRTGARLDDDRNVKREPGWLDLKARAVGYGSLAVTVVIEGVEIHALVDTGSGATVLNGPAFEALQEVIPDGVTDDQASVSASGRAMAAHVIKVPGMTIGDWALAEQRLVSAHLPIFSTFGASHAPAMILGMDVLLQADTVAMDFKRWRMMVRPREAAVQSAQP